MHFQTSDRTVQSLFTNWSPPWSVRRLKKQIAFSIPASDCVCVQVEWESYPLGSAIQTEARDNRKVPESDRRQISAADGQRESRCQVHSLLLQVVKGTTSTYNKFREGLSVLYNSFIMQNESLSCRQYCVILVQYFTRYEVK